MSKPGNGKENQQTAADSFDEGNTAKRAWELIRDMQERGVEPDLVMRTITLVAEFHKANQILVQNATINRKTGLYSAYALEERFEGIKAAVRRHNKDLPEDKKQYGLCVFADMVDLTGFNKYGHHMGDAAIHASAMGFKSACRRPGDMPVRLHENGDEFALVFPLVEKQFIEQTLPRRLIEIQKDLGIQTPSGYQNIGFRYHTHLIDEHTDFEDLMKKADPKLPANIPYVITLNPIANAVQPSTPSAPPPPAAAA